MGEIKTLPILMAMGIANALDLDDDNDGILDTVEDAIGGGDVDGDGIVNRLDLDSDNDGINDVIEADGTDVNGDGQADGIVGTTPGTNGIPSSAGTGLTAPNTDATGNTDPYDLDSDGDGTSDLIEAGLDQPAIDLNNDGIVDGNTDPDGDGILSPVDVLPNLFGDALDTDRDGVADTDDLDDDNDGILDTVENAIGGGDVDSDGIVNRLDLDSDNDGVNDVIEADGTDTDGDGKADGIVGATPGNNGIPSSAGVGLTPPNTDGTGNTDPYDLDSDGDGSFDGIEAGLTYRIVRPKWRTSKY